MITEDDRRDLGDLAIRSLDSIEDYGEDATLSAATIVFEVRHDGGDGREIFSCEYKSLDRNSPRHIAGILQSMVNWLTIPEIGEHDPIDDEE